MTSKETERRLAGYERIVRAMERMTVDELAQLRAWEKQNVTGDGRRGTSDWPGWQAVFERLQH